MNVWNMSESKRNGFVAILKQKYWRNLRLYSTYRY